jgi:hypothetical protein
VSGRLVDGVMFKLPSARIVIFDHDDTEATRSVHTSARRVYS